MDTGRMISELKSLEVKHRNDKVFTGQLNITEMAHDVRKRLEELKPYEDTSLTPGQIMELKERDTAKRVLLINGGIPVCPECGAKVLKHYTFCKDCGQKLEQ